MVDDYKRKGLSFLLLAVVLTILLATALPQLELKPGIPLPAWGISSGVKPQELSSDAPISISSLAKAVIATILGVIFIFMMAQILRGARWGDILHVLFKQVLPTILVIILPVLIAIGLLLSLLNVPVSIQPVAQPVPTPAPGVDGPPLGSPPAALIWLAWVALVLLLVLLAISIIRWRAAEMHVRDPIRLEAERAVDALRRGLDLRSIILRCYEQMSLELKKEQGIELEEGMTAREFERLAKARGIPEPPIHQLTMLFEVARYADRPLAAGDEQIALDCLTAIVRHDSVKKQERRDE